MIVREMAQGNDDHGDIGGRVFANAMFATSNRAVYFIMGSWQPSKGLRFDVEWFVREVAAQSYEERITGLRRT